MHSFALLALASLAFAIPVPDVVHAPVNAVVPIAAVSDVYAKVVAPVEADIANVNVDKANVANDVLSGNSIHVRGLNGVNIPVKAVAPIDAVTEVYADVIAPVKAAVGNVQAKKINVANGVASGNHVQVRALPVVNAPVEAFAPVNALTGVYADVKAPVNAAIANVNVEKIKGFNGIASANHINARGHAGVVNAPVEVISPVKAVTDVTAKAVAPVYAAVANADLEHVNAANVVGSGNKVTA